MIHWNQIKHYVIVQFVHASLTNVQQYPTVNKSNDITELVYCSNYLMKFRQTCLKYKVSYTRTHFEPENASVQTKVTKKKKKIRFFK